MRRHNAARASVAEPIVTRRLALVALSAELARAALEDRAALARLLGAEVPGEWPQPAFAGILPLLAADLAEVPRLAAWSRLIVTLDEPILAGEIGFKAPPSLAGSVDVGYSIISAFRGRGLATEAVRAMVAWAFAQPLVERVTAETLPENLASQRVLEACGFVELERDAQRRRWGLERV